MGVKRIAIVVAVVCLMGISGCSANGSTIAATVDDVVITEASIQQAADAMYETLSQNPEFADKNTLNVTMLQHRLSGAILSKVAARFGVRITDAEREAVWEQNFGPQSAQGVTLEYPLWTDPRSHEAISGWIDFNLVNWMLQSGELDGQLFFAEVEKIPVTLNPRYGDFDYSSIALAITLNHPGGALAELVDFSKPLA
jgi:hypothetical protein